jgi:hypothetical protein
MGCFGEGCGADWLASCLSRELCYTTGTRTVFATPGTVLLPVPEAQRLSLVWLQTKRQPYEPVQLSH